MDGHRLSVSSFEGWSRYVTDGQCPTLYISEAV